MTLSRIAGLGGLSGLLLAVSAATTSAEETALREAAAARPSAGDAVARAPAGAASSAPRDGAVDFERFAATVGVDPSTLGEALGRDGKPDPMRAGMMEMMFCPLHQRMERRPMASFSSGAGQHVRLDPLALPGDPRPDARRRPALDLPATAAQVDAEPMSRIDTIYQDKTEK